MKAFQFLDEALRPFVKQQMSAVYQENWTKHLARQVKWQREEPIWDTYALLCTIELNWDNVFEMERLRGPEEFGKVIALIKWRHRIQGHSGKPITKNDAEDAVGSVLHLLRKIGANTEIAEVEQILISFQPEASPEPVDVPQENPIKNQPADVPLTQVGDKVEAELKRLESRISGTDSQATFTTEIPTTEASPVEAVLEDKPALRVECVKDAKTKWWLLQIYDGDTFIGSYERTGTEEGAREKETEIPCAMDELRAAFLKNDGQPFVVRYNGDVIGKEGKKGVKQIKDEKTGEVLGQVFRECHRK